MDEAAPRCEDADIVVAEIRHSAELVRFACDLLGARLAADEGELTHIPKEERRNLANRLITLIHNHESLWLKRNRSGGRSDSSAQMDSLLKLLES